MHGIVSRYQYRRDRNHTPCWCVAVTEGYYNSDWEAINTLYLYIYIANYAVIVTQSATIQIW